MQSGAAGNVLSSATATQVARRLLAALKIESEELHKLTEVPIEELIAVSSLVLPMSLCPVLDGAILPQHPEAVLASGSAKDIPILIGTNKDEFRLFTFFDPVWKNHEAQTMETVFKQTFGPLWPEISCQFAGNNELSQSLYDQLMTTHVFTYPALKLAEIQRKQNVPVWMYRFDWESPIFNGGLKACHALEIPFVWNTLDQAKAGNLTGVSANREKLANQMQHAWISFAHNGNPNTSQIPHWPAYDLEQRPVMLFNMESTPALDPDREVRLKWEKMTKFQIESTHF